MESRITIEVDFNRNNEPVLKVISEDSDDVRDRLLKAFLQSLQHTSRWLTIEYFDQIIPHGSTEPRQIWFIRPVTLGKITEEFKLMEAVMDQTGERKAS